MFNIVHDNIYLIHITPYHYLLHAVKEKENMKEKERKEEEKKEEERVAVVVVEEEEEVEKEEPQNRLSLFISRSKQNEAKLKHDTHLP